MNIGFLIYTYNRIDDAKISMEIIRDIWTKSKLFSDIKIIHTYNGQKNWHSKKYLEDDFVMINNHGHFRGAAELIDTGIAKFQKKYQNIDYVIVTAPDTWLIKPAYINKIIKKMRKEEFYWATCSWGLPERNDIADVGSAVDFFIIDFKWMKKYKMFPIDYHGFYKKYGDLFLYRSGNIMLEKLIFARFLKAIYRQYKNNNTLRFIGLSKILKLTDREPVHTHINKDGFWIRKMHWPKIGLITHHDPKPKKAILRKTKIRFKGKNINKLLKNSDLSYYNADAIKAQY